MPSSSIKATVDPGGGVDVEVGQGGRGGQAGEPQPAGQPTGGAGVDFDGQQPLQRDGQRQALGGGLVQDRGQRFGGGVQFEFGQVRAQLLIAAGRSRRRLRRRCGVVFGVRAVGVIGWSFSGRPARRRTGR